MAKIDEWKPEVGKQVFLCDIARPLTRPTKAVVVKVGRTCFYVKYGCVRTCFYIESKKQNDRHYNQYHCYRSEEDIRYKVKVDAMRRELWRNIDLLTDEQIVQVYDMIESNTTQK